jgi:hypothetical protein
MNRPKSTEQQHGLAHVQGLMQPQEPEEPPRRLGSRGRRFPDQSRPIPTDSRLGPDRICYNPLWVYVIVSASLRGCGRPSQPLHRSERAPQHTGRRI